MEFGPVSPGVLEESLGPAVWTGIGACLNGVAAVSTFVMGLQLRLEVLLIPTPPKEQGGSA